MPGISETSRLVLPLAIHDSTSVSRGVSAALATALVASGKNSASQRCACGECQAMRPRASTTSTPWPPMSSAARAMRTARALRTWAARRTCTSCARTGLTT